jgi:hypothetical protein
MGIDSSVNLTSLSAKISLQKSSYWRNRHSRIWKGERQIEFVLPPTIMAITAQLAFHRSSTPIGSPTALIRDGDIEIDNNSC